jgi:hypothetical protein
MVRARGSAQVRLLVLNVTGDELTTGGASRGRVILHCH